MNPQTSPRAERADESELRFRAAVDTLAEAIYLIDPETLQIVDASAGACRWTGYTREELLAMRADQLVVGVGAQELRTAYADAITGIGAALVAESLHRRKDGSVVPVEIQRRVVQVDGRWLIVRCARDVKAHERLGSRLAQAVEYAPSAMVMIDSAGSIVLVNAQTERLFGFQHAALLGRNVEILVPERYRASHSRYRAGFLSAPAARPMGAGRELYALRHDGSEFPVEIGLNPIETDEGVMVLAVILDITERKRAEERFRRVVEAAPNAMLMIDAQGRITLVNSQVESLFGYPRDELLGRAVETLVPQRYRAQHPALRGGFFRDPHSRAMGAGRDLYGLHRDGFEVPIEIGLNPMRTAEGDFVLASIIDITERKRAEQAMARALQEKTVLLNEVHHRVKNNLQVIAGLLYLQARGSNNQEVRATLDSSQIRVKAMALIHQLLYERKDFSQVHLPEYLQRLGALLARTYAETAARIELRVQADPLSIDLTRAVPCGLLVNELVANSFKYAFPDGRRGRIAIDLRHDGGKGMARLRVADDGIGLPPGVEPATAKTLGLQLVAQLCAQVGGRLTHGSGPGTEFEISFPVEPAADREQPA